VRYQKADVRGVGVSFVFIPMGQSPRQKIAPNVSRIKATIPMINNELKQLQSRRKGDKIKNTRVRETTHIINISRQVLKESSIMGCFKKERKMYILVNHHDYGPKG
jgi:hypothetical protein